MEFLLKAISHNKLKGDRSRWLAEYRQYLKDGAPADKTFEKTRYYIECEIDGHALDQSTNPEEINDAVNSLVQRLCLKGPDIGEAMPTIMTCEECEAYVFAYCFALSRRV